MLIQFASGVLGVGRERTEATPEAREQYTCTVIHHYSTAVGRRAVVYCMLALSLQHTRTVIHHTLGLSQAVCLLQETKWSLPHAKLPRSGVSA